VCVCVCARVLAYSCVPSPCPSDLTSMRMRASLYLGGIQAQPISPHTPCHCQSKPHPPTHTATAPAAAAAAAPHALAPGALVVRAPSCPAPCSEGGGSGGGGWGPAQPAVWGGGTSALLWLGAGGKEQGRTGRAGRRTCPVKPSTRAGEELLFTTIPLSRCAREGRGGGMVGWWTCERVG